MSDFEPFTERERLRIRHTSAGHTRLVLMGLGWLSYAGAGIVVLAIVFTQNTPESLLERIATIGAAITLGTVLHAIGHGLQALLSIDSAASRFASRSQQGADPDAARSSGRREIYAPNDRT